MKIIRNYTFLTIFVLSVICFGQNPVPEASKQSTESLPNAEKLMDRFIEVTGGMAAYDKISNRVSRATLEIQPLGIKMSMVTYQAKPNKVYVKMESAAVGDREMGTDGNVVWEKSVLEGPRIKEGDERTLFLLTNHFDNSTYWRDVFNKVECTGIEEVEGKMCYKVVAHHKGIELSQTLYYDKETTILHRFDMIAITPMGRIPTVNYLSDYRMIDGVLQPFKMRSIVMNQMTMITTIETVTQNTDIPKNRFDLPTDIRALLDKKK